MIYNEIRTNIEACVYENKISKFSEDVRNMLIDMGANSRQAEKCYEISFELKSIFGLLSVLDLARRLGFLFWRGQHESL